MRTSPGARRAPALGANGLEVPSEVGREGAAECPGQGPAISEEGSLYPSHSYSRP